MMDAFQVLTAVKGHLLSEEAAWYVHFALPQKVTYPFVLIGIEEIWSSYCLRSKWVQERVKFKVSIYYLVQKMEEAEYFSHKIARTLNGLTLWLPKIRPANIRLLTCVAEMTVDQKRPRAIHHFYEAIVR